MSQLVKGFFGKEGRKERLEKAMDTQQNSDESEGMFRDLEDRTFEPMETTSDKRSNQVRETPTHNCLGHWVVRMCKIYCFCSIYKPYRPCRWTASFSMASRMILMRRT